MGPFVFRMTFLSWILPALEWEFIEFAGKFHESFLSPDSDLHGPNGFY